MRHLFSYIETIFALFLKVALLAYFACFFLGQNVVTHFLSYDKGDYELYEEFETEDSENEKEADDNEKGDKLNVSNDLLAQSEEFNFHLVKAWISTLNYETFQREIPDPPPQY